MKRGDAVEARVRTAVWWVLAGSACGAPPTAGSAATYAPLEAAPETAVDAGPPDADPPDVGPPDGGEGDVAAGGADASSSAMGQAVLPPPPTEHLISPMEARRICIEYRAHAKIDRRKATERADIDAQRLPADGLRVLRVPSNIVQCEIVHERRSALIDETITPRCCPPFVGPCPPPSTHKVRGERILLERVLVRADGTRVKGELVWSSFNPNPTVTPYCGRRPDGFALSALDAGAGAIARQMAELEHASIRAFERLARELSYHGAPDELPNEARAAQRDEVRHARVLYRLARRMDAELGGEAASSPHPETPLPCRDLATVAAENAVEGGVFETFGALIATFQSARAPTSALRRIFANIAADETRHAALAARVEAWAETRLSRDERERIAQARSVAVHALRASIRSREVDDPRERTLGLPTRTEALALCDAYFGTS